MQRLIFMLLLGPFWVQLLFAGGLGTLGYVLQSSEAVRIAAAADLLQSDAPPTTPIADMRQDYVPDGATEVSVTAQIALSHNTRLIRTTYFITTSEQLLYVLVDPDATASTDIARAAIVFDPDDLDRVTDWIAENAETFGGAGPVLTVTGLVSGGSQVGMVSDALSDQGMTKGPDFFYITPHFEGRVAALTPKPYAAFMHALWVYAIATAFLLLGAIKFARRRPSAPRADAAPSYSATAPSGLTGQQIADRLIAEDIARARAEAAFANPKIASGGPVHPPRPAPEMFVVPDPVYTARDPSSPVTTTPHLGDGTRMVLRKLVTPQTVAFAGCAVLLGIILFGMMDPSGNPFAVRDMGSDLGADPVTLLYWVGGLIAAMVVLKGFVGIPATSGRKGIYDPYLRLAERERQADAAPDHPDRP